MATEPLAKRVNIAVTQDMKSRVLILAGRRGIRESDVVRRAIEAYLRKEESR